MKSKLSITNYPTPTKNNNMKSKSVIIISAMALAGASFAQAQTTINITGATAFREAADAAILASLTNAANGLGGAPKRARTDITLTGGSSASNLRIYRGFIGANEYIIRATFSGSTQGILDLADQNSIPYLKDSSITYVTTGTGSFTGTQAANCENAASTMAFSDVEKTLSARPTASLGGGPVGVVPFMFVMGKGAPAGMTNMTDQIHEVLWSLGQADSRLINGVAGTAVLATGRNNGSGTRATILSETGYGSFRNVIQFNATAGGAISEFATNGGHTSNSGVSGVLGINRLLLTFGGAAVDAVFAGYLTISDAVTLTGYNETTGASTVGNAVPMTYNGVRYSVANVRNGSYTLWGYQQLYTKSSLTTTELAFDTTLRAAIPTSLTASTGIAINTMNVTRSNGDGGVVAPSAINTP